MTDLLPAGDKVDIDLLSESVTVSDGKTWRVTLLPFDGQEILLRHSQASPEDGTILSSEQERYDSVAEVTLHEGDTITVEDGACYIRGWEFDYSE